MLFAMLQLERTIITKIDPCNKSMCIIPVLVDYVTEAQHIKLLAPSMTCYVDWKQDRESHATTDKGHGRGNLEISQEEEGIERVVVEDIAVRYFVKGTKPIEQSFR
jgi:hypothetical protein